MFAVIKTGGKQYRVAKDDVIAVEKLAGDAGASVAFSEVLMLGGDGETTIGAPLVDGATVAGEVVEQTRDAKIIIFKKKRRQNYRRTRGHRQHTTLVRITDILTGGAKPKVTEAQATPAPAKVELKPEPVAEAPATEAPAPTEATAAAQSTAAGGEDDLKEINGIGPVIEKKLNALGITTFAQIAAFTPEDIDRVNEQLSFKGRIEREDWVAQAAKLADQS